MRFHLGALSQERNNAASRTASLSRAGSFLFSAGLFAGFHVLLIPESADFAFLNHSAISKPGFKSARLTTEMTWK